MAGRGWGATIIDIAGVPLIRIDQIWTSRQLRATNAFADRPCRSDHRLVVADFLSNSGRAARICAGRATCAGRPRNASLTAFCAVRRL